MPGAAELDKMPQTKGFQLFQQRQTAGQNLRGEQRQSERGTQLRRSSTFINALFELETSVLLQDFVTDSWQIAQHGPGSHA